MNINIPKDRKEVFRIGDFDFELLSKQTVSSISDLSREVCVILKAKTNSFKKGVEAKLLDDYGKDGMVTMTIPAKGIYKNGVPTGQMYFEDGKTNAPLFLHARTEGFDYGLQFCGVVSFEAGWVIVQGDLTKSYDDLTFPVFIAKKLEVSRLKWQNYRFTSMEETTTANAEDIRFLYIENPNFTKLPKAIFTFKNLEELTISQRSDDWESVKLPLKEIQEDIRGLTYLKTLRINGTELKHLPEGISLLRNLEHLYINECSLKTVPGGILQLPKLKFLWLSANKITLIPEDIDLPALEHIGLDKNQLETLPESLARQPKLHKIDIRSNPLIFLPDVFNRVETIELAMEDKLRLLDFGYKGADGMGLVPWVDDVFWAQNDRDLLSEIHSVIVENQLQAHATALRSTVKKAIGFTHAFKEDYGTIGNHRFGGMPDLPNDLLYPEFFDDYNNETYKYEFLGQINCGEIAHLQDYLPRTGMLFFFFETIHRMYGGTNNPAKVMYSADTLGLVSGKRFQFAKGDYFEMFDVAYSAYTVDAAKINSVPSFYAAYVNKHLFMGEAEKLMDDSQLLDCLYNHFEGPINEKNPFQYAVNAHGFTQHEAPELQASLVKKGNPQDWMTLLTITSAGDMQWGDAGDLFFVIHKSDLAQADFSNVFVTMESS